MDINETPLPGVGIRYDFQTDDGRKLAVVSHHMGRRDVVIYDSEDPDFGRDAISLTEEEAGDFAEILGAARIAGPLLDLQHRIEGLAIDWLTIRQGSAYVDRPLSDTRARTRTGVSIVAVLREEIAFPAPSPSYVFEEGDVLVVVGTSDGIRNLAQILAL